jgi:hypothetical protein
MKKIIFLLLSLSIYSNASFMDKVGDLVESTLSDDDKSFTEEITTVGTMSTVSNGSAKKSLVGSVVENVDATVEDAMDSVKDIMGFTKKTEKKKVSLGHKVETVMKEVTGLKTVKADNSIFNGGIMGEMADMIDLEKGESFGLPSVFGFNEKKQSTVLGSTVLGDTILGDAKDASTSFYRGFKNSGESSEFMSGMMYKSSKIYNGMFDMFDDSIFNIFDDKDEREPSIFDIVDHGNSMLDMLN